jgi:2-polyprenyl-6-methoxyphenol hydroxylase-like FAD-dependent oxidoreductase
MGRVAIVGAGPGGAVLAFLLARRGVEVHLLERQDDFEREFRGEVMLPGGLLPFREMGLWDELMAVPHVEPREVRLYLNGRLRIDAALAPDAFGGQAPLWVSQPGLLEMLVREAARFPSFHFHRGTGVGGLLEGDGRVTGVQARGPGGDLEIRADLVVGADGRGSLMRRRGGFEVHSDPMPMDVVWVKLPPLPEIAERVQARAYLGRGHLMFAAPIYDGKMQMAWIIAKGSFGEIRRRGMPECIEAMARHASPDLARHLLGRRDEGIQPFLLSVVSDRVRRWARPGLLLIGDAAHTMSPVGAQGINHAIRDAVVAANHLGPVLEGEPDPPRVDAAAARVQAERGPEVAEIQRLQAQPPKLLLRDTWWAAAALEVAFFLGLGVARLAGGRFFRRFMFGSGDVRVAG